MGCEYYSKLQLFCIIALISCEIMGKLITMLVKISIRTSFIKILCFCLVLFLLFISCSKKNNEERKEKEVEKAVPLRSLEEQVLLILGEAYYQKHKLLECLRKEYNEESIKKNVHILTHEKLMEPGFMRLKIIEEKVSEIKPTAIISLGIPERAGQYLLKAGDEHKDIVIISNFGMEEIAKLEAASDIVLDFKLPDEQLLNPETDFYVSDSELSLVLLSSFLASESIRQHGKKSTILPIEDAKEAFKKASLLLEEQMGKNEYTLKPYIDTDVGMASYNYIMIHKTSLEN